MAVSLIGLGNRRSIIAMLIAVGAFSLMDAVLKTLTGSYPALQVAALRGLAALPLVCVYVVWRREVGQLLRVRWRLHLFRGVIGILMLSLFSYALRALGLAEAYAIFFIAPLLITMLSIPVLGETGRAAALGGDRRRHGGGLDRAATGRRGLLLARRAGGAGSRDLLCGVGDRRPGAQPHRRQRDAGVLDHGVAVVRRRRAGAAELGADCSPRTGRCCWRWRSPVSSASWPSPRPSATARPRRWRRSNTPRWPGASRWTGACGASCPTATRLLGGAIIIVSGLYLLRKERVKT